MEIEAIALNIEEETVANEDYRRVVSTSEQMQLVFMSLRPGVEIGSEVHPATTQFIRVEEGTGLAVLNGQEFDLYPGMALFIPAGTEHNVINTGIEDLKLYTLYAPPEHPDGLIEEDKVE